MKDNIKKMINVFVLVTIFAIAMGFLEAAVVVYVRELYYPNGFEFPLITTFVDRIFAIEVAREFCTIVMLVVIGIFAGKNFVQRFSYFLFAFAVWDIFYYVGLKFFINWPASLMTWDVLFFIPITWVGPVLAPVICSLTMIVFCIMIVAFQETGHDVRIKLKEWLMMTIGMSIILYTFMIDFFNLIYKNGFLPDFFNLMSNDVFLEIVSRYVPGYYNWPLFWVGEALILFSMILIFRRARLKKS